MTMIGKKWPRYFAILIALVMLVETIAFTMTSYAKNDTKSAYKLSNEDKATVSEISNMTGVKSDEIIKLREKGKSWNEILELIKNNPDYASEGNDARKEILSKSGMEEATLQKLKEEGYTEEQIIEAKSLVERVIFQLNEITNMQVMIPSQPEIEAVADKNKEEDMAAYGALAGKINLDEAAYLILKLSDELGGTQVVLDEYLCALQLGLDLNLYLADKEAYQKQKEQKTAELGAQEIITAADIEEKMLDMLQNMNEKGEGMPVKAGTPSMPGATIESPLPEVEAPNAQDIKPQNPAEAIKQEIENMKSSGTGQDGRQGQ